MTIKLKKGMFILKEYQGSFFYERELYYINRESKKYFYSDEKRCCIDYKKKKYKYYKSRAAKWLKKDNEYGIRLPDIGITKILEKASDVERLKSYKEIFDVDVRNTQDETSMPLAWFRNAHEVDPTTDFKIRIFETDEIEGRFTSLFDKLKELFNVKKVYSIFPYISEYKTQTDLTKTSIVWDFNMFHNDKRLITQDENYCNRKLRLWLFEDFLIYQIE